MIHLSSPSSLSLHDLLSIHFNKDYKRSLLLRAYSQYVDILADHLCHLTSAWQPSWKTCPIGRIRNQILVYEGSGNFHQSAHFARVRSAYQDLRYVQIRSVLPSCVYSFMMGTSRRHSRPILRPFATFRIWRVSTRSKLSIPRGLRRQRKAVSGDHLSSPRLQNQISRKFLHLTRQPRMCQYQQDIWLL